MAAPDHTALTHLSHGQGGMFTSSPGGPPLSAEAAALVQQRLRSKTAGIAMAIDVITCLLIDSDACERAQGHQRPAAPSRWPLSTDCADGLAVAVHYLHQYARTLDDQHAASVLRLR